jgi:hypothetical protein
MGDVCKANVDSGLVPSHAPRVDDVVTKNL